MAKSDAMVWRESSGTVGKELTITKRKSGKIQIGKHRKKSSVPATEKQLEIQRRFKNSSIYARAAMKNPDVKAEYQAAAKDDQSAYNLALRDAFKAPEITLVNTAEYTGAIGSKITVRAFDDFRVASVKVKIANAAGEVLEQGDALLQDNALDWIYTATVLNDVLLGSVITVSAKDLPANEAVKEVVV